MVRRGYIAFDLGAESGRAILATLADGRLTIEEAHRFLNVPQRLPSGLHWNLLDLWANLIEGLRRCGQLAAQRRVKLVSLGVDTWGVDFALVGRSGQLLGLPFAYRDARNSPAMRRALKKLGAQRIYDATGIQFLPFNTLYQFLAQHQAEPGPLQNAHRMLMVPDLLHYFFSGKMVNEATNASTTQMVNPRPRTPNGRWEKKLLADLGLPTHMLGPIVPAGTRLGKLRPDVAAEAGVAQLEVIAPGTHDTASAVAAVPADVQRYGNRWAYLSSGTWSLMGAELDQPLITDAARRAGFTNEHGVEGKTRFLKNLAGLWLVQEVRRDLARGLSPAQGLSPFLALGKRGLTLSLRRGLTPSLHDYTYAQLTDLAAKAAPFRTLVDPAHPPFAAPGNLPAKLAAFAHQTHQPQPRTPGAMVRCCLESLALAYRQTLDDLETLLGHPIDVLHIVGGGGHNVLLNQFTADAIARPVIVGPYEATAIGNALTQAIGAGHVRNLAHARAIVRASFKPTTYQPHNPAAFEAQRPRFAKLLNRNPR
jgi:rhamnulokinase